MAEERKPKRTKRRHVPGTRRFKPEFPMKAIKELYASLPAGEKMFVGIDPGLKGAVAFVPQTKGASPVILDMPTITRMVKSSRKGKTVVVNRRRYDYVRIAMWLDHAVDNRERTIIVLERSQPRPEDTPKTAFGVGVSYGMWLLYFAAFQLQWVEVAPSVWKPPMGLSFEKDISRSVAMKVFPNAKEYFKAKSDDGRAEAALVAVYWRIKLRKLQEKTDA